MRRRTSAAARALDPVVVSVTSPLNRQTALELARELEQLEPNAPVVVDLTAIPSFDTDGAETLLGLQQTLRPGRVSIVGFRQATARLVGTVDDTTNVSPAPSQEEDGWVLRRLRNLVVVQPAESRAPTTPDLDRVLTAAASEADAAIIVVDLRDVADLPPPAVEAIAFASSHAAVRGQELLVVNVAASIAEVLRTAGLSATTYVEPEPPYDPSTG